MKARFFFVPAGLFALLSFSMMGGPEPALADPPQGTRVHLTPIGDPIWRPVDFHLFSAEIGTFETGFEEFLDTMLALLPRPHHRFHPQLGVGPGAAHDPPYDTELAEGLENLNLADQAAYTVAEFSGANGVYLVWMNVPDPGVAGRSPDFASGPIIPNQLFPIDVFFEVRRNGQLIDSGSLSVPALDANLTPPFPNAEGHSHFPIFFADGAIFFPDLDAAGTYEYRALMLDQDGHGWSIKTTFKVR